MKKYINDFPNSLVLLALIHSNVGATSLQLLFHFSLHVKEPSQMAVKLNMKDKMDSKHNNEHLFAQCKSIVLSEVCYKHTIR